MKTVPSQEDHDALMARLQDCLAKMRQHREGYTLSKLQVDAASRVADVRIFRLKELLSEIGNIYREDKRPTFVSIRNEATALHRELGEVLGVTEDEESDAPTVTA